MRVIACRLIGVRCEVRGESVCACGDSSGREGKGKGKGSRRSGTPQSTVQSSQFKGSRRRAAGVGD
jgi:hypothetical protein